MSSKTEFKKTIRDQPWDYKTKNEYEDVTVRHAAICTYALPPYL